MDLSLKQELVQMPLLRKRLQQMRGFVSAFDQHNQLISSHLGIVTEVDQRRLHRAFFNWVAAAERLHNGENIVLADRIVFLGGLALRELLRSHPVKVVDATEIKLTGVELEGGEATTRIAQFWPEGFIYTNFCICSIAAVHEQEVGAPRRLADIAYDLKAWWSYRENVSDDVNLSIGFLDLFLGVPPNWLAPDAAPYRRRVSAPAQALLASDGDED